MKLVLKNIGTSGVYCKREIKAIYIENSVPVKTVQALQKAVLSRGFNVKIGGELYSDSLGNKNTIEGIYIGHIKPI